MEPRWFSAAGSLVPYVLADHSHSTNNEQSQWKINELQATNHPCKWSWDYKCLWAGNTSAASRTVTIDAQSACGTTWMWKPQQDKAISTVLQATETRAAQAVLIRKSNANISWKKKKLLNVNFAKKSYFRRIQIEFNKTFSALNNEEMFPAHAKCLIFSMENMAFYLLITYLFMTWGTLKM